MACTCPDESCTQIIIGGTTYCDCLVSQDGSCPEGSEIVNIGEGVLVCRTIQSIEPTPCGIVTCDTANGFVYNPVTEKCEKITLSEPCGSGYIFVPTNDGVGKCVPALSPGTLLCPEGYTYDSVNKRCTKITSTPAESVSITSCKADIIIVQGINSTTLEYEKIFINRFIDNISTYLNSTSHDIRVGVTNCLDISLSVNNDLPYMYSGPGASDIIKGWFV